MVLGPSVFSQVKCHFFNLFSTFKTFQLSFIFDNICNFNPWNFTIGLLDFRTPCNMILEFEFF